MLSFCLLINFFFSGALLSSCQKKNNPPGLLQKVSRNVSFFLKPISVCCIYPIEYAIRLSDMKLDHNPKELRVSTRKSIYSTCESAVRWKKKPCTRQNEKRVKTSKTKTEKAVLLSFSHVFPSYPVDTDNMNNFVTLLGKLFKVWQGRLEVINYSNVSSEPCRLRRASLYNMHVRRRDETTP